MRCVLDCSAAFELVLGRPGAGPVKAVLESADLVLAPALFKAEMYNVLWKYVRSGHLSRDAAIERSSLILDLIDDFTDTEENGVEALAEAVRLDHSAYDMLYLTLARREGAVLLTCDRQLAELASREGVSCPGGDIDPSAQNR